MRDRPDTPNLSPQLDPLVPFRHEDPGSRVKDPLTNPLTNLLGSATVNEITPLAGSDVSGIQLSQLTDAQRDELAVFVARRRVVVFRSAAVFAARADLAQRPGLRRAVGRVLPFVRLVLRPCVLRVPRSPAHPPRAAHPPDVSAPQGHSRDPPRLQGRHVRTTRRHTALTRQHQVFPGGARVAHFGRDPQRCHLRAPAARSDHVLCAVTRWIELTGSHPLHPRRLGRRHALRRRRRGLQPPQRPV